MLKKFMKKGDIVIIILIVLTSVGLFYGFSKKLPETMSDQYISIQIDGEEVKKIYFTEENVGKTFPIQTEYGLNVLSVEKDRCCVIEADCPDKIDVLQGWISQPGEMLVCLPHHLIIEIKSTEGFQEIDAINR